MKSLQRMFLRRHETDHRFALLATLLYAIVIVVAHFHHEMWRDEIHCWMIGRNATGFWDVITGERRYDGHPFLWYYLLHLVSRVVNDYVMIHIVTAVSAIGAGFLWVRYAPLPRYARLLALASYYLIWEYTVINRAYVLGVLLTFLFCSLYDPRRIRYGWLAVVLALLSATSAYGTIIACSLALFLFTQRFSWPRSGHWSKELPKPSWRSWFFGATVFSSGLLFTVATTLPPRDVLFARGWNTVFHASDSLSFLERFWKGTVPVPRTGILQTWQTNFFLEGPLAGYRNVTLAVSALLLLTWLIVLFRRPRVAMTFAVGVSLMGLLQHVKYAGGVRHFGHYFILLLACIFLLGKELGEKRLPKLFHPLFTLHIGAHILAGYMLLSRDYSNPFTGSLEVAQYLQKNGLDQLPLIGTVDAITEPVVGFLKPNAEILYLETNEIANNVAYTSRRQNTTPQTTLDAIERRAKETGKDVIIISPNQLSWLRRPTLKIQLLYTSTPAIRPDEHYVLYRASLNN